MAYIERSREPSELDNRLEVYKDRESGHVILTSQQAREVLIETLLSYYRSKVDQPSPKLRP